MRTFSDALNVWRDGRPDLDAGWEQRVAEVANHRVGKGFDAESSSDDEPLLKHDGLKRCTRKKPQPHVIWPVMFSYSEVGKEVHKGTSIKCIGLDGVFLSNNEVMKTSCFSPEKLLSSWWPDFSSETVRALQIARGDDSAPAHSWLRGSSSKSEQQLRHRLSRPVGFLRKHDGYQRKTTMCKQLRRKWGLSDPYRKSLGPPPPETNNFFLKGVGPYIFPIRNREIPLSRQGWGPFTV
jgi:hypothetical protein